MTNDIDSDANKIILKLTPMMNKLIDGVIYLRNKTGSVNRFGIYVSAEDLSIESLTDGNVRLIRVMLACRGFTDICHIEDDNEYIFAVIDYQSARITSNNITVTEPGGKIHRIRNVLLSNQPEHANIVERVYEWNSNI